MFNVDSVEISRRRAIAVALVFGLTVILSGASSAAESKAKAGSKKSSAPRLSAAEIIQKHASARGGQQSWGAVQALSMSGKLDAGSGDSIARGMRLVQNSLGRKAARGATVAPAPQPAAEQEVQLPFRLSRERPNKSRLEIDFAGKTAVQVYDGKNGWKLRPFLNRKDVEPFTPEEAKIEEANEDIADPLINAEANGTKVEVTGVDKVEGRNAYKLTLTKKSGVRQRIWVDAKSFLDVKVEGVPRKMDGRMHDVWVFQRDFRSVQGLKIPFVLETVVDGYPQKHRIVIEKVSVNPKLAPTSFDKPKAG